MALREIVTLIKKHSPYADRLAAKIDLADDSVDHIWTVISQLRDGHTWYCLSQSNGLYTNVLPTWNIMYSKSVDMIVGTLIIPSLPIRYMIDHNEQCTRVIQDALNTFMNKSVELIDIILFDTYGDDVAPYIKGVSVLFNDKERTILYGTKIKKTTTFYRGDGTTTTKLDSTAASSSSSGDTTGDCTIPIHVYVSPRTSGVGELLAVVLGTLPHAQVYNYAPRTAGALSPTTRFILGNENILTLCVGDFVDRHGTPYASTYVTASGTTNVQPTH